MSQVTWTDRFGVSWTWTSCKVKSEENLLKKGNPVKPERKSSRGIHSSDKTNDQVKYIRKENTGITEKSGSTCITFKCNGNVLDNLNIF